MTKQELKIKNENLFLRNTMLLNENQKLRNKITILLSSRGCETCTEFDKLQLTKAKEIIKTLADDLSMYPGNYQKELLEAEQFIKEIEK